MDLNFKKSSLAWHTALGQSKNPRATSRVQERTPTHTVTSFTFEPPILSDRTQTYLLQVIVSC